MTHVATRGTTILIAAIQAFSSKRNQQQEACAQHRRERIGALTDQPHDSCGIVSIGWKRNMPDCVQRVAQLQEDGRGAKCQGDQAEQSRNHAYARLVGAFDDCLNRPRRFRTGHSSNLRREPAFGSILPINNGSQSDGYHK
jgi:hypothetical protein